MLEDNPSLQTIWDFIARQDETTLIIAGSFIFVIFITLIFKGRQPRYGYDSKQPLMNANTLFLKLYPLFVFACWVAIIAGLALVGMGVAAHFEYIDLGQELRTIPPLEFALYACAIPFGAAMGLWRFADKKKAALARIAAHEVAEKESGPVRTY